jgi:Fe-S-cluster containining protein
MKHIDSNEIDKLPGIRIDKNDTFSFHCHPDIACFNRCCRNLNLFLYPYDVVRLKQALDLSSDEFLDRYVDIVLRPANFFPDVLLRMAENPEKTCPFLSASGCSVYADRPDTCRTFPIEQGLLYVLKKESFLKQKSRIGKNPYKHIINHFEGHEINDKKDAATN